MTVDTTAYVETFNTNVIRIHTSVPPPLSRSEDTYDRRSGRYRKMRRAGVSADIDCGSFCELKKSFQGRFDKCHFAGSGRGFDLYRVLCGHR